MVGTVQLEGAAHAESPRGPRASRKWGPHVSGQDEPGQNVRERAARGRGVGVLSSTVGPARVFPEQVSCSDLR